MWLRGVVCPTIADTKSSHTNHAPYIPIDKSRGFTAHFGKDDTCAYQDNQHTQHIPARQALSFDKRQPEQSRKNVNSSICRIDA
jgi:hypothetical protein